MLRNLRHPLVLAFVAIVLALLIAGGYLLIQQKALADRLSSIESQTAAIATALQGSNLLTEEGKRQLQEATNRGAVIAQSQDALLTSAVEKAAPAVVSIVISKGVALLEVQYVNPFGNDPFYRDIGFRVPVYRQVGTEKQQIGAGTGFIVRSDGYILTNRHVVVDPDASYTVLLSTGEQKTARVVHRDPHHDIAVLKIEGSKYPAIELGRSADLKLGQTVAAIGNALGEYNNSVSVGIISGLGRTIEAMDDFGRVERLEGVVQTDAAINRGNSGGPLLDLNGRAVGVNVAVDQGATNIAFAIPIDTARAILQNVLK